APLAGHGALGRRELARHQLRGVRGVRRLRRVALVAAGTALVLVAALAALAYVASTHFDRLLAEVGKGLGRELAAERVGFTIRLEDIVSEGVLELAGGRPTYQGSLRAGPGAFGSLAVKQITAKLHASPPVLDLESATLQTLGGTVEGTAHLTSEGKGAGLTARLDARGLDLAELPAPKGRPRPAGTLEL